MGMILTRPRGGSAVTVKEVPTGTIDGVNDTFATSTNYYPNTLTVYLNGLREKFITELGGNQFKITRPPRTGHQLFVEYDRF